MALQVCWFLWQREQQACRSAIQHTSGALKTLLAVEEHGTLKASPTVLYSSGWLYCRRAIPPVEAQRDSLSLLSPFLHLQAITTASASVQMLISAAQFACEKVTQDHHLLLSETQW